MKSLYAAAAILALVLAGSVADWLPFWQMVAIMLLLVLLAGLFGLLALREGKREEGLSRRFVRGAFLD